MDSKIERPATRFQLWLDKHQLTHRGAARECKKLGHRVSAAYLKQIASGYYRPGYDLSKFLSVKLCKGALSVEDFMDYPYLYADRGAA